MNPQINLPERLPRVQSVAIPQKRKTLHQWRLHLWNFEKTKFALLLCLFVTLCSNAQFLSGDRFQFTVFTDIGSAIEEETIPHTGVEITYIPGAIYISGSLSYFDLDPSYTDWIFSTGININLFNYQPIRYYLGPRIGVAFRAKEGFPLAGGVAGLEWEIADSGFAIGYRFWIDYRTDQEDQAYGDSSAYERGWFTNNSKLQENGAVTFSWIW